MNRLRAFSVGAAAVLVGFAVWGALRYRVAAPFLFAAGVGLFVVALVPAARRLRLAVRRRRQRERSAAGATQAGAVYVSTAAGTGEDVVGRLRDALAERDGFDPSVDEFSEGEGLTVVHTGFHNAFVRVTRTGRLAVTGGSEKTRRVVDAVADATGLEFERRESNPMLRPRRLGNKTRLVVWVVVCASLFVGLSVGTTGAYPADTYNSAERMVLTGVDLRDTVDPRMTATERRLTKADFLAHVVAETPTEMRWERNRSAQIVEHARQAATIAGETNRLLAAATASGASDAQAARAERIRERLDGAVGNVSDTIGYVIAHDNVTRADAERLRTYRERLRANATRASVGDGPATVGGTELHRRNS